MIDNEEIEDMLREIRKNEKDAGKRISLADLAPQGQKSVSLYERKKREMANRRGRTDGRKDDDHRPMFIQLGTVSDARGSCYVEIGDTKVVVSIRGPKEIPNLKEYTEMCEIECLIEYAPFANSPTTNEGYMCHAVRQALEPAICRHEFPNFQIAVSAFVIEDRGSVLSAIINGASLALTHARLPCFGIVSSVIAAVCDDRILMDPEYEEEAYCQAAGKADSCGLVTLSYMPDMEQITFYEQNGYLAEPLKMVEPLVKKCQEIHKICIQHALKEAKSSVNVLAATQDATNSVKSLKV
ncbi:3' exoribonuclease family, domain 1 [Nesidiocoris tenuis]|uniref:3' exoribonuclease family, domain 1 n=1 Tax=Nesidiocoris tenuis TaxID=355587 RepID=A0ABN7B492_9HEMI|nr:3' exoribonuclease family, domain 1 [Nesidiocoris tenuis]